MRSYLQHRQTMPSILAVPVMLLTACPETVSESPSQAESSSDQPSSGFEEDREDKDDDQNRLLGDSTLRILSLYRRAVYRDGKIWQQQEKTSELHNAVDPVYPTKRSGGFAKGAVLQLWVGDSKRQHQPQYGLPHLMRLLFGDFSAERILVAVNALEVSRDGDWSTLADFSQEPQLVDLLRLHSAGLQSLGIFYLEAGHYDGLRFRLSQNHSLLVDEGQGLVWRNLRVFSGAMRSITLSHSFTVPDSGYLGLRFDFSSEDSLIRIAQHYFLRPTISLTEVSSSRGIRLTIGPDDGAQINLAQQLDLSVPAGAFEQEGELYLEPLGRLGFHRHNFVKVGQEYRVSFENGSATLAQPVKLSFYFAEQYQKLYPNIESNLDVYVFDETLSSWHPLGAVYLEDTKSLEVELWQLGTFVLGFDDESVFEHHCFEAGENHQLRDLGLDLNYFAPSCLSLKNCHVHGGLSYGLSPEICVDQFTNALLSQCRVLCGTQEGSNCDQGFDLVQEEDSERDELTEVCFGQAEQADALVRSLAPELFDDEPSCHDYQPLGVDCGPPSCELQYLGEPLVRGDPSELRFQLQVTGSAAKVSFDETPIYHGEHPVISEVFTFEILETERVLLEPKTFTAEIMGLGILEPIQCSAEVDVVDLRPCRLAIVPDEIDSGGEAALLLTVMQGWGQAQLDLRSPGSFVNVSLSMQADGTSYFHSLLRPQDDRSYRARVFDSEANLYECSAILRVN